MRLLHRFGYYLGGFAIGLIILAFFFSGKKTSCAYFPQARTLKKLKSIPYTISNEAESSMKRLAIDTLVINRLLHLGEVNFGKSETRKEPCKVYYINGETASGKALELQLDLCNDDEQVIIKNIVSTEKE